MKIAVVRYFIVITAIAMVVGCGKEKKEEPKGEVLARVNGKVITMDQFNEEQAKLSPDIKATLGTAEGKKEFLEGLVRRELLLAKAEKLEMGNDPSVAAKIEEIKKTLIIEAFLKKEIEEKAVFTEKEAEAYYNSHKGEFEGEPFEKIKDKIVATQTKTKQKDLFEGSVNSLKKEAKIEIDDALIEKITKIEGLISTGNKSIEEGDYEKGITAYKEALTLAPQDKIVAASKEKAEKVQKAVEEFAAKKEPEKKEILKGLEIKVVKAEEQWLKDDRGGESCYPTVDFKVINNTPYHVKVYSAEVQYSYYSHEYDRYVQDRRWIKKPLSKDSIILNNTVKKDGSSKLFTSLAKYGFDNCRTTGRYAGSGVWDTLIAVEFTIETSMGQIYRNGKMTAPGTPYLDDKGRDTQVGKSGFL